MSKRDFDPTLASNVDFMEDRRMSTIPKRVKRRMDTAYLYLFGFNYTNPKYMDIQFHWQSGLLKDIRKVRNEIRHQFVINGLDLVRFYCGKRGEDNMFKRERKILYGIVDWIGTSIPR